MRDADLRGADLTRADLTEADLTGADLAGTDVATTRSVTGAQLRQARGLSLGQQVATSNRQADVDGGDSEGVATVTDQPHHTVAAVEPMSDSAHSGDTGG